MDLLNFILEFFTGDNVLSKLLLAIVTATLKLIVDFIGTLILQIVKQLYGMIILNGGFLSFDYITTGIDKLFLNKGNISVLGVLYTIVIFILSINIIVCGLKMVTAEARGKEAPSPQKFITKLIFCMILILAYPTIVNFVIEILNALSSAKPFDLKEAKETIENFQHLSGTQIGDEKAGTELLGVLVLWVVLYFVLIKEMILAIFVHLERLFSFAIYLLFGPIAIAFYPNDDQEGLLHNWLVGILSQMTVILFSLFAFRLFFLQMSEMNSIYLSADEVNATPSFAIGIGSLARFAVLVILLDFVKNSEQMVNMLGLRTIPSGDTARAVAGSFISTAVAGWSLAKSVPTKFSKLNDHTFGNGRNNGFKKLNEKFGKTTSAGSAADGRMKTPNELIDASVDKQLKPLLMKNGGQDLDKQTIKNFKKGLREDGLGSQHMKYVDDSIKRAKEEVQQAYQNSKTSEGVLAISGLDSKFMTNQTTAKREVMPTKDSGLVKQKNGTYTVPGVTEDGCGIKLYEKQMYDKTSGKSTYNLMAVKGEYDDQGNLVKAAQFNPKESSVIAEALNGKQIERNDFGNKNTASSKDVEQPRKIAEANKEKREADYTGVIDATAGNIHEGFGAVMIEMKPDTFADKETGKIYETRFSADELGIHQTLFNTGLSEKDSEYRTTTNYNGQNIGIVSTAEARKGATTNIVKNVENAQKDVTDAKETHDKATKTYDNVAEVYENAEKAYSAEEMKQIIANQSNDDYEIPNDESEAYIKANQKFTVAKQNLTIATQKLNSSTRELDDAEKIEKDRENRVY